MFSTSPFESFDCVIDFIEKAASDPNVLAIKQTLYRVSGNSPIINSLIKAAENGKQVTVLVEIKARFDEQNNITWARKLDEAGCHVIYGLVGLKIHCKATLVVRKEIDGIKRYVHLSTGNYNDKTAALYTDIGYFTSKESFASDISSLFNALTGYAQIPEYNKISTAPNMLRQTFINLIRQESTFLDKGRIIIKINSLVDPQIINELYLASSKGVKIDLIVRGICCLNSGIPEISDNIRVISIISSLLEHSRIFSFGNNGNPKMFLSSADLMQRNLDRRVEILFPIEKNELKNRITDILELYLSDSVKARIQKSDGAYARIDKRGRQSVNSQIILCQEANNNVTPQKPKNINLLVKSQSNELRDESENNCSI